MRNARFQVWSGLLYGLISLHAKATVVSVSPFPKLMAVTDLGVEQILKPDCVWLCPPGHTAKTISQVRIGASTFGKS